MDNYSSVLTLENMVFDKIEFNRIGFKNENEIKFSLKMQIGFGEDGTYRVTLILNGIKQDEYTVSISLTGIFSIKNGEDLDDKLIENLIKKNTVAILMPYLRSELTLLTAQPETDSVVLPPFNVTRMIDK